MDRLGRGAADGLKRPGILPIWRYLAAGAVLKVVQKRNRVSPANRGRVPPLQIF